jgi:aspartyl-tRNA(Asn)/glutamyl-tRNA(Gln) amidotransferase subunit A
MDHPGPMARTVEDVALLLGAIAGFDPLDSFSRNKRVPSYVQSLTGNIHGLRIGVPHAYFFEELAPEVDRAIRDALKVFERLGATVQDIKLDTPPLQRGIWSQIACPEAFSFHEKYLAAHGDQYGVDVRGRIEVGRLLLSVDYVRAQRARTLMKEECKRVLENVDVIVTPSLPVTPPRIDQTTVQRGSSTEHVGVALTRFTRHFNITGLPCLSIPCGFTSDGLPIGMQIAGRAFDEVTVLQSAHAYEQDTRWFERRPV